MKPWLAITWVTVSLFAALPSCKTSRRSVDSDISSVPAETYAALAQTRIDKSFATTHSRLTTLTVHTFAVEVILITVLKA